MFVAEIETRKLTVCLLMWVAVQFPIIGIKDFVSVATAWSLLFLRVRVPEESSQLEADKIVSVTSYYPGGLSIKHSILLLGPP